MIVCFLICVVSILYVLFQFWAFCCKTQSFSIDKQYGKRNETLLQAAIRCSRPMIAEMLLKEYNANPNTLNNQNETSLHICCSVARVSDKIAMMQLLEKYNFDFAKLINVAEYKDGQTVFHVLCEQECLECLTYIIGICNNIKNCKINTLIKDSKGRTGLHHAIAKTNFQLIKFLLEHVYFPNNDKSNKNGIKCIQDKNGVLPLNIIALKHDCSWDIFELLISYGMDITQMTPKWNFLVHLELAMQHHNRKLLQIWYNYFKKHKIVSTKEHDAAILETSAKYTLITFKTVLSMILTSAIITSSINVCNNNDNNREGQIVITQSKLHDIMLHPKTSSQVSGFIKDTYIMNNSDINMNAEVPVKWRLRTIVICNNGHEIDTYRKIKRNQKVGNIKTYLECSMCNLHSNCRIKCNICGDVICDNCATAQISIKEINDVDTTTFGMTLAQTKRIELTILRSVSREIKNRIVIHRVESFLVVCISILL